MADKNFEEMTLEELYGLHDNDGKAFTVEDGKVTGVEVE